MKTVALISSDREVLQTVISALSHLYRVTRFENINLLFEFCITTTPDIIVIDAAVLHSGQAAAISTIKSDPLFGSLPILVVLSDVEQLTELPLRLLIDDYIVTPFTLRDLELRVEICISRSEKVQETNPLTRLPGNITITREIEKRIASGEVFAFAYADMDNFKPFNDRYGFSRGDEVLRMTGRVISNIIKMHCPDSGFVGHIGGDDFVFIVPLEKIELVCAAVLKSFDEIIHSFYDAADWTKGCIESVDREGKKRTFPVIGLSIGVSHNQSRAFSHYGEVSEIASEMKKFAKTFGGSCFKIDRRER